MKSYKLRNADERIMVSEIRETLGKYTDKELVGLWKRFNASKQPVEPQESVCEEIPETTKETQQRVNVGEIERVWKIVDDNGAEIKPKDGWLEHFMTHRSFEPEPTRGNGQLGNYTAYELEKATTDFNKYILEELKSLREDIDKILENLDMIKGEDE
jgi:hypothetical protein